jgi:hypothetical protein
MKKQLMRVVNANLFSKFFKATALVVVLSAGSSYVNAQVTQVSANVEHAGTGVTNAVINHLGTSNGMLLFEVKVDNASGEKFRVIVKDIDGTILFQDTYEDKNFAKKFMIPKPDSDRLVFVVKSASGKKTQSFEINSSTRVIEEVVVKRI